jgi:hypothetical protein
MLKHNEINPLAVFGMRRMDHCPPHFVVLNFDIRVHEKKITDWIWENLDGRFYLGDRYQLIETSGSVSMQKSIGFEIPGEASYFSLILDTINTDNYNF